MKKADELPAKTDELFRLGVVSSAVGLRGELRVFVYADGPEIFEQIDHVLMNGKRIPLISVRRHKGQAVITLAGISDRQAAEDCQGKELFIERAALPALEENSYYIKDLIGLQVQDEAGAALGELAEVLLGPAQDIYRVAKPAGGNYFIPAVEAFVVDVDLAAGRMTVRLIEGLDAL